VDFTLNENQDPVKVTLDFTLGKRYEIAGISVMAAQDSRHPLKILPSKAAKALHLQVGEPVDLTRIQDASQRLLKHVRDHGYPYAEMAEPEGQIDRNNKRLHIIFRARPGPYSTFGKTTSQGLKA